MIEIVSAERCTGCNICVHACPTNVFDIVPGQAPRIARQSDCQTCYMCELYCPEDALFVAPDPDAVLHVKEGSVETQALLGSYRKAVGWGKGRRSAASDDRSFELMIRAH